MQTSTRTLVIAMASLAGLLMAPSGHAGELTRGAMLSASCEGCHGTNGHSPGSIPDISGKSAEFIHISLEEFRSGERASTVMTRHAKGYTDEEILLIADYFAQRK
jgi:sulfide dehydrogenase cytochrome subunit